MVSNLNIKSTHYKIVFLYIIIISNSHKQLLEIISHWDLNKVKGLFFLYKKRWNREGFSQNCSLNIEAKATKLDSADLKLLEPQSKLSVRQIIYLLQLRPSIKKEN